MNYESSVMQMTDY